MPLPLKDWGEKGKEAKRRNRRMVLYDEYRINGVNATCKRAIAPKAFPILSSAFSFSE